MYIENEGERPALPLNLMSLHLGVFSKLERQASGLTMVRFSEEGT